MTTSSWHEAPGADGGSVCIPIDAERPVTRAIGVGAALAAQLGLAVDLIAVPGPRGWAATTTALEQVASGLRQTGLTVRREIIEDESAARAILEHVVDRPTDLLCMATRASHGPVHLVFGSVAETVMAQAPVPVLALGPHAVGAPRFHRIVACLDGSAEASAALLAADRLRARLGAALELVEVLQPSHPFPADVFESAPLGRAEGLLSRPADGFDVLHGHHPAAAIVDHLAGDAATITVLGTRGRTGLRSTLLGSVARQVVGEAHGPVLVVPPGVDGAAFLPDRRVGSAT